MILLFACPGILGCARILPCTTASYILRNYFICCTALGRMASTLPSALDKIKKTVAAKKKEGDVYFKKNSYGFAGESYRSAIRLIESTPESSKALKKWNGIIAGMLSVCCVKQGAWKECIAFAENALKINPKNSKAYACLAQALESTGDIAGALDAGENALALDPENHDISLVVHRCAVRIRGVLKGPKPRSSDFESVKALGEGNYCEVVLAKSVWTEELFALKVLNLMMVKKKEKRHKNIKNEIMMEKEVLSKLDHPNVVKLHHTFSDAGALYYLFEYHEGVTELWSMMLDETKTFQVGLRESMAQFMFAQIINGVEYIHSKGIVHRDLKPENMMVRPDGHLFIIDFGTCKNLIDTRLNGPEFVGTAEYMSPEAIENKTPCTTDSDLWSLGAILYQMLCGPVAFKSASEYYTFLRVSYGKPYRVPFGISDEGRDLVFALLHVEPGKRLGAGGNHARIKEHPFFASTHSVGGGGMNFEALTTAASAPLPSMKEVSMEAVAKAACEGARPKLYELDAETRSNVKHYLKLRNRLNSPEVLRLFYKTRIEFTFSRVDLADREVLGLSREEENRWTEPFFFVFASHPLVGPRNSEKANRLRKLVQAANAMRPRPFAFVACGDLTEHGVDDGEIYEHEVAAYKDIMSGLAPSILVVSIGSTKHFGALPLTKEKLANYHANFGADYFQFWKSGVCFLVLNCELFSMLETEDVKIMKGVSPGDMDASKITNIAQEQLEWFKESCFLSRTCSKQTILLGTRNLKLNKSNLAENELEFYRHQMSPSHSDYMLHKMEWSYVKTALGPHPTRNSRSVHVASGESYEANDVSCIATSGSDGLRVVRMFEGSLRSAFFQLGADMITKVGLDPKVDGEEIFVSDDVTGSPPTGSSNLSFTSQEAYEQHLSNLSIHGAAVTRDPALHEAGGGDDVDGEEEEEELVVEEVTGKFE